MKKIIFVTGNLDKLQTAKDVAGKYGVDILQKDISIAEIQDENPRNIAQDKSNKAYEAVKLPVLVSDDTWCIPGLNGFPGPYMHSVNEWFTPDDFLRLTLPLENRVVTLTQYLVYTDGRNQKVFKHESNGKLLKEVRGSSEYPSHTIIALDSDNGLSIAEAHQTLKDRSLRDSSIVWHEFIDWFTQQY